MPGHKKWELLAEKVYFLLAPRFRVWTPLRLGGGAHLPEGETLLLAPDDAGAGRRRAPP